MTDVQLEKLRNELDTIDIELQDLLRRRADISLEVKKVKSDGEAKLKPGREAQILRTLIERHQGHFPKPELIRIWREILSASLQAQGKFSVAVYVPEGTKEDGNDEAWGYVAAARGHYGAYTSMSTYPSQRRVIEAVNSNESTVGILPLPRRQEEDPWWRYLAALSKGVDGSLPPRVISRLPFVTLPTSNGNVEGDPLDALVIAKSEPDSSGLDCSYFVLDLADQVSSTKIDAQLVGFDMSGAVVTTWHDDQAPERWLTLIKVDGFLTSNDSKLLLLTESFGEYHNQTTVIGSYAVPLDAKALAPSRT